VARQHAVVCSMPRHLLEAATFARANVALCYRCMLRLLRIDGSDYGSRGQREQRHVLVWQ
jgi:hypothetical protein